MHNVVGLPTPRGSGTSGYTQANRFQAKPRRQHEEKARRVEGVRWKEEEEYMAEHGRRREVCLRLLEMEEALVGRGCSDEVVQQKVEEARKELEDA